MGCIVICGTRSLDLGNENGEKAYPYKLIAVIFALTVMTSTVLYFGTRFTW